MLAIQGEYGLRPPMVFAMKELDEPKPMGEIAELLACDNSQMTWITDRLEEQRPRRAPGRSQGPAREADRAHRGGAPRPRRDRPRASLSRRPEISSLSAADQRALRDLLRKALAGVE